MTPEEYHEAVKQAVSKLLDLVSASKWRTLQIETDENCPSVQLWLTPNSIAVYGHHKAGWISPEQGEDSWSFLECCQKALEAAVV